MHSRGGKGGLRAAFSCPKRVKTTAKTGSVPICYPPILNWALAISTRENGRDSGFIRITPKSAVFGFGNCCRWLCEAVNFCMVCHLWSYRAEPCHRRRMIRIKIAVQSSKEDPRKRLFPRVFPSCHSRKFPAAWRFLQRFAPSCAAVNDCGWLSKIWVRSFPLNS